MTLRVWKPIFCLLTVVVGALAHAQPATQQADYIIAVVNSEPITESEVRVEMDRLRQQYAQQPQALPAPSER